MHVRDGFGTCRGSCRSHPPFRPWVCSLVDDHEDDDDDDDDDDDYDEDDHDHDHDAAAADDEFSRLT